MTKLKPWATGPYELLRHAEQHLSEGNDFDRRMALINYDNAIELAIVTYLNLDPKQRGGRPFQREHVTRWLVNYHSKLDFLEHYIVDILKQPMLFEKEDVLYYHRIRNQLYHADGVMVPRAEDVASARSIAHWVFAALCGIDPASLLQAEEAEQSAVIATNPDPLPEDRLFAALIDLRQDIAELRKHTQTRGSASDEHVVENLLRAEPAKETDELKEALRRAKKITGDLSHDRPVSASKQEISQLIQRLEMLKHRVEVPLREFQEKLAGHALLATLAAVAAHRHLIGHIYQPTGSGLTTTALEYLRQVLSHDPLRDFTIIVATDRAMLIEQLYQRISRAEFLRARRVQRVTRADLTPDRLHDPSSILVTTTQALRAARFPGSAPEKTLVIVFDLNLNQPTMMTRLLTQRYVISFTNSTLVSDNTQGNLIASYSLHQAQQDGVLVPLTFEFRPLTPDDSVFCLPPGFDVIEERQDIDEPEATCSPGSSAWTESRIRAISEDIVEHFKSRFEGSKALVIVSGIADGLRFAAALRKAFFDDNGNPDTYVAVLNSAMTPEEAETVMRCFASRDAHPSILVCGRTWMGVDLAAAQCAYLTCRLSSERFWKFAGQLCARVDGKRQATIVDYVGNAPSEFPQTGN